MNESEEGLMMVRGELIERVMNLECIRVDNERIWDFEREGD